MQLSSCTVCTEAKWESTKTTQSVLSMEDKGLWLPWHLHWVWHSCNWNCHKNNHLLLLPWHGLRQFSQISSKSQCPTHHNKLAVFQSIFMLEINGNAHWKAFVDPVATNSAPAHNWFIHSDHVGRMKVGVAMFVEHVDEVLDQHPPIVLTYHLLRVWIWLVRKPKSWPNCIKSVLGHTKPSEIYVWQKLKQALGWSKILTRSKLRLSHNQ